MIAGIDIFRAQENGLPDVSKIPVVSIFNGSVSASLESMKTRAAPSVFDNEADSTDDKPTRTQVVPKQKQPSVVERMLSGGLAKERKSVYGKSRYSGGYSVINPEMPGGTPSVPDQPLGGGDVTEELPNGDTRGPSTDLLPVIGPPTPDGASPDKAENATVDLPALWSSVSNKVIEELKNLKLIN